MKLLTKEWIKIIDLNCIADIINSVGDSKIPLVFDDDTCGIEKEYLHTIKTEFPFSERENKLTFTIIPNTFRYYQKYCKNAVEPDLRTPESDFQVQYTDRLQAISNLPENILELIRDKRMLALGYIEKTVKEKLTAFLDSKKIHLAYELWSKVINDFEEEGKVLTVAKQIEKHEIFESVSQIFEDAAIIKTELLGNDIFIKLESDTGILLNNGEIYEMETTPEKALVKASELCKTDSGYELHLLLLKRDKNLVKSYYYATYKFKDMKLIKKSSL